MLGTTRKGTSLWIGAGAAILAVGLTGCGGGSKKGSRESGTAGVSTSTTGGTTSGTVITPPVTPPTTPPVTPPVTPPPVTPPGVTDDHTNAMMGATPLASGIAKTGIIQFAGDQDWFKINLDSTVGYDITTLGLGAGMDSILRLMDASGAMIAENDDPAAATAKISLVAGAAGRVTGDHYVVVLHKNATATTGTYSVKADLTIPPPPPPAPDDHGGDAAGATALTVGTAKAGVIGTPTDEDWFKVDLVGGSTYVFTTQNLNNGCDTYLFLINTDGTSDIAANDDVDYAAGDLTSRIAMVGLPIPNGSSGTGWTCPTTGTYYLDVFDAVQGGGDYEVLATLVTGTPTPPPTTADDHKNDMTTTSVLALGTPMPGMIEVGGDLDWFKVDLVAGKDYEFRTDITTAAPNDDTMLKLMDATGAQLAANDDENYGAGLLNSKILFTATATGTHFLEVKGFLQKTPGYTMSAIDRSAPVVNPPVPPTNAASLSAAMWNDVDGSKDASIGDTLTMTFSEAVATAAGAAISPATDFALAVAGDSFGTNATAAIAPANSATVVITLGTAPKLRMTGTFNPSNVTAGSASGIEVKATTTIITAAGSLPAAHGQMKDIGSNVMPGFFPSADMVEARGNFAATVMNDGRVLVTGGMKNGANGPAFAYKNEIYDPVANAWTEFTGNYMAIGGYAIGRYDHTQTLLPNGKVLIAGGYGFRAVNQATATTPATPVLGEMTSAFLFNPVTNLFELAGALNYRRDSHYATVLPNGQVLISGGFSSLMNNNVGGSLPACELYDPTTNVFTPLSTTGNDMYVARESGSTHVVNGNVLHVGGHHYGVEAAAPTVLVRYNDLPNEELDVAGQVSTQATRGLYRRYHDSIDVAGGFLLIGGTDNTTSIKSIEKFDAAAGTYTAIGDLTAARSRHGVAMVGADVLVVGGVNMVMGAAGSVTDVATGELYNVAANVTESYQLGHARNSHRVVQLKSGKAMVIGGWEGGVNSLTGTNGTVVQGCEIFAKP